MANILLVEPSYRSKFPPLGLMRIATLHKSRNDSVTFTRGKVPELRDCTWHRVYVSSLFTWELPRTVDTVKFYQRSVPRVQDVVVGGIGVTLMPDYVRAATGCSVVVGQLDEPDKLFPGAPAVADLVPDYSLLDGVDWKYRPEDAYFCRATRGCIRRCKFCAVPKLEPTFERCSSLATQVAAVANRYGERQHLVILDNNVLAVEDLPAVMQSIIDAGFPAGAKRNNRQRTVDFNQGIDARLVTRKTAKLLRSVCLSPVRLAFDCDSMEKHYRRAVEYLHGEGFLEFTNYVLFNYQDTPESLYRRLRVGLELCHKLGVRITGFPMRFVPMDDVHRQYVSAGWKWRYLRGVQCILHATRGLVSPNPEFFEAAFGRSYEEFLQIVSMPDRYIIHRKDHRDTGALAWQEAFAKLDADERNEFLDLLEKLNGAKDRVGLIAANAKYAELLEHYYPAGMVPHG